MRQRTSQTKPPEKKEDGHSNRERKARWNRLFSLCLNALSLRVKVFSISLLLLITCAGGVWLAVPDPVPQVLSWPVSPVLLDKRGELVSARLSTEGEWCLPIPLSEMGEWLPKVLVAVEDKRFYSHGGVDMLALGRAVAQNITKGRVVSGASTITSQLVRLSNPRERTFGTKILEFVGARKLERSLSKDQILEYYLNRAPFGGPIRGVEAASRLYFGKRAKELSLGEAALLVGLLKGPTLYRPDRNPKGAQKRRQQIIAAVAEQTGFPENLTALALEEPLPAFRTAMPARAWHFADLAFKTLPANGGVVRGSLDMRVQEYLERVLREQLDRVDEDVTAAGIVIDNRSGRIIAYVGNARFDPVRGKHWVDCALAPRSPGSTLKPFAYLAAMEAGHIIPATLLADTPLRLGGEAPRNFDRRYRGPVRASLALSASLNAPAVRVLRMVGVRHVLYSLRDAGFSCLSRNDADYGDSLVLGAGEVTLLELARTYTTLASGGRDRELLLRGPSSPADRDAEAAAGQRRKGGLNPLEQYGSTMPQGSSGLSDRASRSQASPGKERFSGVSGQETPSSPGGEEHYSAGNMDWSQYSLTPLPSGLAGVQQQVLYSLAAQEPPSRQIYSEAASFLIADILQDTGRLPFLAQLTQARDGIPFAFKTGTSYGLRDAWTAAYCPAFTVAVWFGKENGGPDPRLLGLGLAAPAATRVIQALTRGMDPEDAWYSLPAGVAYTSVCALSGRASSAFCPATRMEWSIPEVWRTMPCDMHIMRDGQITVVWPPELEDYSRKRLAQKDLSRKALIVSPLRGAKYLITPGARTQPITLKAEGVVYPVHWYVEGEYLGEQEREDLPLYWLPLAGEHTLSLLDSEDRVTSTSVEVVDLAAGTGEDDSLLFTE